jgi:hypothetical protein
MSGCLRGRLKAGAPPGGSRSAQGHALVAAGTQPVTLALEKLCGIKEKGLRPAQPSMSDVFSQ